MAQYGIIGFTGGIPTGLSGVNGGLITLTGGATVPGLEVQHAGTGPGLSVTASGGGAAAYLAGNVLFKTGAQREISVEQQTVGAVTALLVTGQAATVATNNVGGGIIVRGGQSDGLPNGGGGGQGGTVNLRGGYDGAGSGGDATNITQGQIQATGANSTNGYPGMGQRRGAYIYAQGYWQNNQGGMAGVYGGIGRSGTNANGGAILLAGGGADGTGTGGTATLQGGNGMLGAGVGGNVMVTGGVSGSTGGVGGNATLIGGGGNVGSNASGGNTYVRGGAKDGTGTDGLVYVGDLNTTSIHLGIPVGGGPAPVTIVGSTGYTGFNQNTPTARVHVTGVDATLAKFENTTAVAGFWSPTVSITGGALVNNYLLSITGQQSDGGNPCAGIFVGNTSWGIEVESREYSVGGGNVRAGILIHKSVVGAGQGLHILWYSGANGIPLRIDNQSAMVAGNHCIYVTNAGAGIGVYSVGTSSGHAVYGSTSNASAYGGYFVNTAAAGYALYVTGSGVGGRGIYCSAGVNYFAGATTLNGNATFNGQLYAANMLSNAGNNTVRWISTGTGQLTQLASDSRIKTNIVDYTGGLDKIVALTPRQFTYRGAGIRDGVITFHDELTQDNVVGLIAQEVQDVMPEVVQIPKDPDNSFWGVDYERIVPALINAVKTLKSSCDQLREDFATYVAAHP
jgi:hypothetical protein